MFHKKCSYIVCFCGVSTLVLPWQTRYSGCRSLKSVSFFNADASFMGQISSQTIQYSAFPCLFSTIVPCCHFLSSYRLKTHVLAKKEKLFGWKKTPSFLRSHKNRNKSGSYGHMTAQLRDHLVVAT